MAVSETVSRVASPSPWMPRRLLSDGHLARLAGRGDRRAFEAIFERYHQELYRYCRAILADPHEAQDALQSTMANALRALPGEERRITLRPWLYRVAHNESISILRQRSTPTDGEALREGAVPGADSEAEARERLRTLVADLGELPDRQRGALVMRELSGLSYAEIGSALDASEGAARQAVYEARLALRELDLGREMECDAARRALSERDGRILRSRRLRAHLRACEECEDFRAATLQRRADLEALCPPLPAVAASGLLSAILGGTGKGGAGAAAGALGGSGAAGIAGGTTITGSAVVKGASIAAAVALGAGAAGMGGVVKLPLVGDWAAPPKRESPVASGPKAADAGHVGRGTARVGASKAGGGADSSGAARRRSRAAARSGAGTGEAGTATQAGAGGQASNEGSGLPAPSQGKPPAHSSAGGQPGDGSSAGADPASQGKPDSPPGLGNAASNAPSLPAQSEGKPGAPPGHAGSTPASGASAPGRGASTSARASSRARGSSPARDNPRGESHGPVQAGPRRVSP